MNNPLELEIVNIIKIANSHLLNKQFTQCLQLYDQALNIYATNKSYNESVNSSFEGIILSLKGFACLELGEHEEAENLFNRSLKINTEDTVTLMRRATLYSEINRFSEAIEDAEKVYLSNPNCRDLKAIFNSLETKINKIDNEEEKLRLKQNLASITTEEHFVDIEICEDEILSFSNLKSIDKISTPNHLKAPKILNLSKLTSKNSVLEESIESEDEKEENNSKRKIHCTHLLKTQSINLSPNYALEKKELERSSEFSGFIENKVERRTSVRFSENTAGTTFGFNETEKSIPKSKKTESEKRKSCLRTSKLSFQETTIESQSLKRASSFADIKKIDGVYVPSLKSKLSAEKDEEIELKNNETNKSLSDSDDGDNEYCIYGNRLREISITQYLGNCFSYLENLTGCTDKKPNNEGKKNSILKKNSFVASYCSSKSENKGHKKSVCFADENSGPSQ